MAGEILYEHVHLKLQETTSALRIVKRTDFDCKNLWFVAPLRSTLEAWRNLKSAMQFNIFNMKKFAPTKVCSCTPLRALQELGYGDVFLDFGHVARLAAIFVRVVAVLPLQKRNLLRE